MSKQSDLMNKFENLELSFNYYEHALDQHLNQLVNHHKLNPIDPSILKVKLAVKRASLAKYLEISTEKKVYLNDFKLISLHNYLDFVISYSDSDLNEFFAALKTRPSLQNEKRMFLIEFFFLHFYAILREYIKIQISSKEYESLNLDNFFSVQQEFEPKLIESIFDESINKEDLSILFDAKAKAREFRKIDDQLPVEISDIIRGLCQLENKDLYQDLNEYLVYLREEGIVFYIDHYLPFLLVNDLERYWSTHVFFTFFQYLDLIVLDAHDEDNERGFYSYIDDCQVYEEGLEQFEERILLEYGKDIHTKFLELKKLNKTFRENRKQWELMRVIRDEGRVCHYHVEEPDYEKYLAQLED